MNLEELMKNPVFARELESLVEKHTPEEVEEYRISIIVEEVTVKGDEIISSEIIDRYELDDTAKTEMIACTRASSASSYLGYYNEWRD